MKPVGLTRRAGLWVPLALIALATVPVVAGFLRVAELAGGQPVLPVNPRIAASPAPAVLHIASGALYLTVGAFLFSSSLRRRWPQLHRRAGQVLVLAGFAVALTALWMTQIYPREPGTGTLHYVFRTGFGVAMATFVALGVTSIRRQDVAAHRAWMIRAYALAAGAGTQVFTQAIQETLFGHGAVSSGLALGAGWAINMAAAEYIIVSRVRAGSSMRRVMSPAS